MISPSAPKFRKRHKPLKSKAVQASPPAALTLVAAYYDGDAPGVHLTFDRPVDLSAVVVAAFTVIDGPESIHFVGTGVSFLVGPTEVLVFLHNVGVQGGPDVLLTAGAGNGIVAVDDGGTWAGVTDLSLPFP